MKPKKPRLLRWFKFCLTFIATAIVLTALLNHLFPLALPAANGVVTVVDRHGQPLRHFADNQGIWRYPIQLEDLSPNYLTTLLHYEDKYFYTHPGVNPFAIVRAAWQNWRSGRIISGGSTLTMQTARIIDPHTRSFTGKLKQVWRALQLEWYLSKDQILTLYINHAPFGGPMEGVQAASYHYLGKPASYLTDAEAALLAVLPQAPSYLRPDRHPKRAQQYRDKVLHRLLRDKIWSEQRVKAAKLEQVVAYTPQAPLLAPLLTDKLRQHDTSAVIQTTIDAQLQWQLQDYAISYVNQLPPGTTASVLVVDNTSHEVVVYIGNAAYGNHQRDGYVNMIDATRSPGSTLKPFLYGMALDKGLIHENSLLIDAPRQYGEYRPQNFDQGFHGPVAMRDALLRSLNLPAVQVLEHYGVTTFYSQLENSGLDLRLPAGASPNLSMILGGVGVTLWDLVTAYQTFSNDGKVSSLATTAQPRFQQRQLLSPASSWLIGDILRDQVPPGRLATNRITHRRDLAWKTGTSYGHRDAWAIGFTPRWTIGVWVGRPDGSPLPGHYGAVTATPMLLAVQEQLEPSPSAWPQAPDSISEQPICWPLGTLESQHAEDTCHRKLTTRLIEHSAPPTLDATTRALFHQNPVPIWLSDDGRWRLHANCPNVGTKSLKALWPPELEPWLPIHWRSHQQLPPIHPDCNDKVATQAAPLEIVGLSEGQKVISLGENQPVPSIDLSALGGTGIHHWYLNGQYQGAHLAATPVKIPLTKPGVHQIVISDEFGNSTLGEVERLVY